MQCGAACLAMVCRCHGKFVSLTYLENEMHMGRLGVSMAAIMRTAAGIGLKGNAYRLDIDELAHIPLPAILHWNRNHFVILYRVSNDRQRFCIADPGSRCFKMCRQEFGRHFLSGEHNAGGGIVLALQPGDTFDRSPLGEQRSVNAAPFLKRYMRPFSRYLVHMLLALGVGSIAQLLFPFLTQWIVDIGIRNQDIGFIWLVLAGELMLVLGTASASFIRGWMMLHISARINLRMLDDFLRKLLCLPMRFFEVRSAGDILQRMSDHGRVQAFITDQSVSTVFSLFNFIIFSCILLSYETVFFLVFMAFGVAYILWILCFMERRRDVDYELFGQQSESQDQTLQLVGAIREIKLQGCCERRLGRWRHSQMSLLDTRIKTYSLSQIRQGGALLISEARNLLITVLAASYVIKGGITLGQMMAVQYIIGQLQGPMSQFIEYANILQDLRISFERIGDIHGREDENRPDARRGDKVGHGIVLDSVSFGYDRTGGVLVIDNVSLSISKGRTVAVVGASGSGKTTLLKLMLGYYPVSGGSILIDGHPIGEYDMDWWRSQCGVVMQDSVLFRESVAANIAISDNEERIDMDRVRRAASLACADEFIESLPLGYRTVLGENGHILSMGQKQRILIARAIYKNPQFVFLDEATNSLDATNEKDIVGNLGRIFRNKGVVVIAHRLSTVRDADTIAVLDKGRLVEVGDHASLMELRGHYYSLVKNQLADDFIS